MGQAAPASDSQATDTFTVVPATDHPEVAEFSSLPGKFAGAEMDLKVSRSESQQAPAAEKSTTGSATVTVVTPGSDLRMTAGNSVQIPVAPKSENLVNIPAKVTLHSARVSGSVSTEVAWQKGNEPEAASAQAPLSSSASPVPLQQFDASAQSVTTATTLQNDAAPGATGIQPSGTAYTNSSEGGTHSNLTDSSPSGQGKSGQQSGTAAGDNPAVVIPIAPGIANTPAPDPTANLFAAHAPSDPVSHANASAPPAAPPPSQPPTTLSAWQNYDGGAGSIVRSAALSGSARGAEMHVELRSGALGPMEVHAVMHEGSVGAEIHVQGQEAHTLLAAGLPSLERALAERNLRVENIAVYQDHTGGGASGGGKQDPNSGSSPSPQHQVLPWDSPPKASQSVSGSWQDEELANPVTGLSVRA
jgi:flagellar hook-length control protein FliK